MLVMCQVSFTCRFGTLAPRLLPLLHRMEERAGERRHTKDRVPCRCVPGSDDGRSRFALVVKALLSPTLSSRPVRRGRGTRPRPRHTSHWLPPPIEPGAVSRCTLSRVARFAKIDGLAIARLD